MEVKVIKNSFFFVLVSDTKRIEHRGGVAEGGWERRRRSGR
jgi:hypothetical protein